MTCPRCASRVPVKALWTSTGLSGVICPHCRAGLQPKAFGTLVLYGLCLGLAEATLLVLQWHGADFAITLLGFFVVFVAVHALAAPILLKLRAKEDALRSLAGRRV